MLVKHAQYCNITGHIHLCRTYYIDCACSLTLLSGTDYSLCWRGINVWKFSQCWSQYIFLLPPPIAPSAEDSCPWANTWLLKPCTWNTTLSHDAGPATGLTVVSLSSTTLWGKRSASCLQAKALSLSGEIKKAKEADLPCSGERQQVGAMALTMRFQSTESIWAKMCLQTRYSD